MYFYKELFIPNKLTTSSIIILLLLILFSYGSLGNQLSQLILQKKLNSKDFDKLSNFMPKNTAVGEKVGFIGEDIVLDFWGDSLYAQSYLRNNKYYLAKKKESMEDYYMEDHCSLYSIYGLADGRDGEYAARYLTGDDGIGAKLKGKSINEWTDKGIPEQIKELFYEAQEGLKSSPQYESGSTLTIVLHRKWQKDYIIATVGNTRAYIFTNDNQVLRTEDHSCKNPNEIQRLNNLPKNERGNSEVALYDGEYFHTNWLLDGLNLSRIFGYSGRCPTGFFTPDPYVYKVKEDDVKAIFLTTDGAIEAHERGYGSSHPDYPGYIDDFITVILDRLAEKTDPGTSITDANMKELADELSKFHNDDIKMLFIPGAYSPTKKDLPVKKPEKSKDNCQLGAVLASALTAIDRHFKIKKQQNITTKSSNH